MNEDKLKVHLNKKPRKGYRYQSYFVKPHGKFWKRYFNKKVRKGEIYRRNNFWIWD